MRIFVTGGTGLLGNTIIRQLLERGHSVSALVRSDPHPQVFEDLEVQLVRGQLEPPSDESQITDSEDAIDAGRCNM